LASALALVGHIQPCAARSAKQVRKAPGARFPRSGRARDCRRGFWSRQGKGRHVGPVAIASAWWGTVGRGLFLSSQGPGFKGV